MEGQRGTAEVMKKELEGGSRKQENGRKDQCSGRRVWGEGRKGEEQKEEK